jgi:hypothetical protein
MSLTVTGRPRGSVPLLTEWADCEEPGQMSAYRPARRVRRDPYSGIREVELQAFTAKDVNGVITAWQSPRPWTLTCGHGCGIRPSRKTKADRARRVVKPCLAGCRCAMNHLRGHDLACEDGRQPLKDERALGDIRNLQL